MTPGQCKAARALLGWSQTQLERASSVHKSTIVEFERGQRDTKAETVRKLRTKFERCGLRFVKGGVVWRGQP